LTARSFSCVITLIPSTILLCTIGDICTKILYERGAFGAHETYITNRALFGYSIGIIFYALSISLVRVFNALHDMKTPALVGITSIFLNAILASILMAPLKNLGISLATSIVSLYNFVFLYILLRKKIQYRMAKRTVRDIVKALLAGIILTLIIALARYIFTNIYAVLFSAVLLTAVVYGLFFKSYYLSILKK